MDIVWTVYGKDEGPPVPLSSPSPVLDFNIKGNVCSQREFVEKAHTRRLFPWGVTAQPEQNLTLIMTLGICTDPVKLLACG